VKIDFKHRGNIYLNCNRTCSVYRCNNVNVSYQQPTCASSQNQPSPTSACISKVTRIRY